MSEIKISAVCVIAASVLLAGFMLIADRHGPGTPEDAGVMAGFICTSPECGESVRRPRAKEDVGRADSYKCPSCGKMTLAPMIRCMSCGGSIPRPLVMEMPAAECSRCGGFVYGGR